MVAGCILSEREELTQKFIVANLLSSPWRLQISDSVEPGYKRLLFLLTWKTHVQCETNYWSSLLGPSTFGQHTKSLLIQRFFKKRTTSSEHFQETMSLAKKSQSQVYNEADLNQIQVNTVNLGLQSFH